jgi:cytochrome c556
MCAYAGCVRAYKVWNRLDSFKNHAKLHKPDDMEALVKKSRKNHDVLRVAITTQREAEKMQTK